MENNDPQNIDIVFDPFPRQLELISAVFSWKYRVLFYGGAIRGGKTFAGLGILILLSKYFPGSRWIVVRDSLQTLKRNTIPSFRKLCPNSFCVGGSIDKAYNQDLQTVTFKNGSQIMFFGENYDQDKELNRWRGLECNGFLLEEINELNEKSFNKAIERAGSWIIPNADRQPPPFILATANPSRNWTKTTFFDRYESGTLPESWFYLPARIFDNDKIPAAYLENLKNLPKYEYDLFVLGDWNVSIQAGDEFYRSFNLNKNTVSNEYSPETGRPELYDPAAPLFVSFDENVNPYITATVWQIFNRDNTTDRFPDRVDDLFADLDGRVRRVLVQIDEFCLSKPNNRIDPLCDRIADRYRGHESGMFIDGDATSKKDDVKVAFGTTVFTLIRDRLAAFRPVVMVPDANPSVVMRGNFINSVFDVFFGGVAIYIGSNCRNSISDYMNVKTDSDGTKNKRRERDPETKITFEPFGHTSDANDYFIIRTLSAEFNQYLKGTPTGTATIVRRSEIKRKNNY